MSVLSIIHVGSLINYVMLSKCAHLQFRFAEEEKLVYELFSLHFCFFFSIGIKEHITIVY